MWPGIIAVFDVEAENGASMTLGVVILVLLAAGALSSCDSPSHGQGAQPGTSSPQRPGQHWADEKQFIDTFIRWAAAHGTAKLEYELPKVSLGFRPTLSEPYSREHLKNFSLQLKQVCPLIEGRCSEYEDGFELRFDVQVSGIALPSGAVEFTRGGRIIRYEKGPRSEIRRVISREDALKRASAKCNSMELTVDPRAEPHFTSYMRGGILLRNGVTQGAVVDPDSAGVLSWMFSMTGKLPGHCFSAECAVDAVTGATEVAWRCGGVARRGMSATTNERRKLTSRSPRSNERRRYGFGYRLTSG
jgi:hypothetical protein